MMSTASTTPPGTWGQSLDLSVPQVLVSFVMGLKCDRGRNKSGKLFSDHELVRRSRIILALKAWWRPFALRKDGV